jgi:hypothetical protein
MSRLERNGAVPVVPSARWSSAVERFPFSVALSEKWRPRRRSSRTLITAFLTFLPIRTAAIKASMHSTRAVLVLNA